MRYCQDAAEFGVLDWSVGPSSIERQKVKGVLISATVAALKWDHRNASFFGPSDCSCKLKKPSINQLRRLIHN
ncbi:MAG: hypothetical protein DMG39_06955 [Acidobacteria bacterium]|nr:MAG: hypothetical protein DMG39_06955 [Acidobacteriota bacterium]